jgi:endonuclease III
MMAIVPPEDAYELHVNLITHGRALCRPKPRCEECDLRRMCPWYRDLDRREASSGEARQ